MKHLTIDEMIDFVSFNKLDSESLALASRVNAHIFECQDCRKKVEAFQLVYNELVNLGQKENIGFEIKRKIKNKNSTKKHLDETTL